MRCASLAMSMACCWMLLAGPTLAAPPLSSLLPDTTKGFLSAPDVKLLQEKMDQTEPGRWWDDPLMKPFRDDLRAQIENDDDPNKIQYGLQWTDVQDLARGEAVIALAHAPPSRPVRVVLVDVTGNEKAASAVLQKIFNSLLDRKKPPHQRANDKWRQETVQGQKLTIFDFPKHAKDPQRPPQMAYFIKSGILGAVEDAAVAKAIMGRLGGEKGATMESIPGYQMVMNRLQADVKLTDAGEPHVRWYLNPVPYAEARRQIDSQFLKVERMDLLRTIKNSGFRGIAAAGGFAHLGTGPYDVLNRAAVYAPAPLEKTLGGIETPNIAPIAAPDWVPANVASFMAGSINLPKLLEQKHIGPLYDFSIGDGDGAWKDTLRGIREDERGPKVDLDQRLFAHTGKRALRITDVEDPITTKSERQVLLFELANPKEALAALTDFYGKDKTADKTQEGEHQYWEIWPEERRAGDVPSGVAVAHGHLMWASHASMLKKLFQDISQEKQLGQDAAYLRVTQLIQAEAKQRSWDKLAIQRFVNSREAYRPTFELTRRNELPLSNSMLGSLINMLVGQEPSGKPRKQEADGSKLPDYSKVQHYFLPAGSLGVREDTKDFQGWFLLGFAISKKSSELAVRKGE